MYLWGLNIMDTRALILDDDRLKATLVGTWLEKYGIDSDKAYTFEEAEARINYTYSYLFIDYFLNDKHTGSEFSKLYQKKHYGCEIYHYSGDPDRISDCTAIDILDLEAFLDDKFKNVTKEPLNNGPSNPYKSYDIYIIKQKMDEELSVLKNTLTRHDEKILTQEKLQQDLKKGVEDLNKTVYDFIKEHSNDARKIVIWVGGLIFTLLTIFVGIEWAIIEHLIKQVAK